MKKKVAFKTLGCRLNLFETDALASQFTKNNYQVVDFNDNADVYVINTCTVTSQSDQKSRNAISQADRKNQRGITIVTGCMATQYKEQLEKSEKIDYVVDNDHKTSILSLVEAHQNGETVSASMFEKDLFGYEPADETFHTRSLIKIQDGCDNFCTFCIIPKVRGRASSRPMGAILENVRKVLDFGYKEIVLTGVNIGRYQNGDADFEKLVEKILNLSGDFRLRISSIEPDGYSYSFFRLFENPKLAPHMHICLQSGSENILLKMRRMYTAKQFLETAEKIKQSYPDFNLTTDIIVGFPGETEEDFQQTVEMSARIGFGHIHTFKFSTRNGTRAERMPEQVAEKIKTQRSETIRQLSEASKLAYRRSFIGKKQRVLVEKIHRNGFASGYGEHYIPVLIEQKGLLKNEFYTTLITGLEMNTEPILTAKIMS